MALHWRQRLLDWHRDPDNLAELVDQERRNETYFSVVHEDDELVGVLQVTKDRGVATIGLGLRLDLTGQGLGPSFVLASMRFAHERFTVKRFRLDVATFDQRAIRVYAKVGFVVVRRYRNWTNGGWYDFLEMVCISPPNASSP